MSLKQWDGGGIFLGGNTTMRIFFRVLNKGCPIHLLYRKHRTLALTDEGSLQTKTANLYQHTLAIMSSLFKQHNFTKGFGQPFKRAIIRTVTKVSIFYFLFFEVPNLVCQTLKEIATSYPQHF